MKCNWFLSPRKNKLSAQQTRLGGKAAKKIPIQFAVANPGRIEVRKNKSRALARMRAAPMAGTTQMPCTRRKIIGRRNALTKPRRIAMANEGGFSSGLRSGSNQNETIATTEVISQRLTNSIICLAYRGRLAGASKQKINWKKKRNLSRDF